MFVRSRKHSLEGKVRVFVGGSGIAVGGYIQIYERHERNDVPIELSQETFGGFCVEGGVLYIT